MRKMKNAFAKAVLCSFILLAGGLSFAAKAKKPAKAAASKMPDWVNQPSLVYPNSAYITYVGSAADRNASEVSALQGLAAIFGQSVKSESNASSRMEQAKADGLVATTSVQAFSQDVKRVVDVDCLVGAEIKEYWQDEKSGTWHALALLDKAKAVDIYSTMIKKNAAAIPTVLKGAEGDKLSLDAFAAYDFAEDIAIENEGHLKKLSVIDPDSVDGLKSFCPSSKGLHAKKMEIAKQIPICVQTFNDDHGRCKEAFSQAISEAGFRGTTDASVRYTLIAKFEFERSDTKDKKTVRCRYNCESYINDALTSHQIVPFTVTGRESQADYNEARVKAEKALVAKIKADFGKAFNDYLKNLVAK